MRGDGKRCEGPGRSGRGWEEVGGDSMMGGAM